MNIFLFLLAHSPVLSISGEQASSFFRPSNVVVSDRGDFYVLTRDYRIVHFDASGTFAATFAGKGQGPGQLQSGHAMLWVAQTQSLWVGDAQQHKVVIYKDNTFVRDLELGLTTSLFSLGEKIVLAPPDTLHPFRMVTPAGQELERFTIDFGFPEARYKASIWKSFRALPLQDNRMLIAYVWTSKLAVIEADGRHYRAWDMSDYYPEYRHGHLPIYFAQSSVTEAADGTIWVLTCSRAEKGCQALLQFDYHKRKLVGRAHSPYPLRTLKRLDDGRYLTIDPEADTIHVYADFPFAVNRGNTPSKSPGSAQR